MCVCVSVRGMGGVGEGVGTSSFSQFQLVEGFGGFKENPLLTFPVFIDLLGGSIFC